MATDRKTALIITGGHGCGMGCWIANKFLLDGDSVILTYSREYEPSIVIMKRDFLQAGPRLATIPIDFLGPEAITGIFDTAATRFHRLDIVVSAVSNGYYPHISQITPEALDWAFAVNPRAQLSIAQQAYKHVTFGGRLILTSSIEGAVAESYPRLSIHSGFKAAIQAFAQSLAIGTNQSGPHLVYRDRTDVYPDFGPREITVNAIAARGIKHEEGHGQARLFIPSANIMSDDDLNEFITSKSPLNRIGCREEVASVVAFLCSQAGGWINGQTLTVSGGAHI